MVKIIYQHFGQSAITKHKKDVVPAKKMAGHDFAVDKTLQSVEVLSASGNLHLRLVKDEDGLLVERISC